MLTWVSENIATIVICVVLLSIVAAIITGIVRDKKKRQVLLRLRVCKLPDERLVSSEKIKFGGIQESLYLPLFYGDLR